MLLEFKTKNYKSFKDEMSFVLKPAPKQHGLDYSVLKKKIGAKTYKGLSSSVIYGPNASGKTNIIGAMDTFKNIVMRGNIRNDERNTQNSAANLLELIPNNSLIEPAPVEFSIAFIEQDMMIEYSLCAEIGRFLDADFKRKIILETLKINGEMVFVRDDKLETGSFKEIKKYVSADSEVKSSSAFSLALHNLVEDELFLMNGFKNIYSAKLTSIISNWIENKFMIIYRLDSAKLAYKATDDGKAPPYLVNTLNAASKYFGLNSNTLAHMTSDDETTSILCSVVEVSPQENEKAIIPMDMFESYGTIRFVSMFPLVVSAILNGGTLVVDEFDASIHPMALMSIINIFHNDEINKKNAQLIFNTHNPIFLNSNLFRRDEIKFVERDDETHLSVLYSLSDFGTTGDRGVRKHDDYMKNYFVSRYGAIKDIDFTPFFEELIDKNNEV